MWSEGLGLYYTENIQSSINPKSEYRNPKQIRIFKIVLRTPHPSGGAPVSNDLNTDKSFQVVTF